MMNANDKKAIFTITSRDSNKNKKFGTGFLIHCHDEFAWFLTCRHVVDDVGGPEEALVEGKPVVDAVMPERNNLIDLSVLRVKAFSHLEPLKLSSLTKPGSKITVEGYYVIDPGKPTYEKNGIIGHIVKSTSFSDGRSPDEVKLWALKIEDSDFLRGGYSGSPVIDSETGVVVAVVTHQLGKGETGRAVSCEMLLKVWPEMPQHLKAALSAQKEQKKGPIILKECNRMEHVLDFRRLFDKLCSEQRTCRTAQFYIIHGCEGECHGSLVKRLKDTYIRKHKDPQWRNPNLLPQEFTLPWPPGHSDFENYKKMILHNQFEKITHQSNWKDYEASTFCTLPQVKKFNIVLIVYHIKAKSWKRHYSNLLAWYMTEYWSLSEDIHPSPLFLIFFNIIYPRRSEKSFLKRIFSWNFWRYLWIKKRVYKNLTRLSEDVKGKCHCKLINEIKSVERDEVDNWFLENEREIPIPEIERLEKLDSLFKGRERVTMAEAEALLEKVYNEIDKRQYERQYK